MKYIILSLLFVPYCFGIAPGESAPDFSLISHTGKSVSLSDLKGRLIVLEWYNEDCPFVKKHYESKNMQTIQAIYKKNDYVSWITIASSAPGEQGYIKNSKEAQSVYKRSAMKSDYLLLDPTGKVGKLYGATATPHMFIVGFDFKLKYIGAIDSLASTDARHIRNSKNYITSALSKLLLGSKPNPQKTKAYGCSIKY